MNKITGNRIPEFKSVNHKNIYSGLAIQDSRLRTIYSHCTHWLKLTTIFLLILINTSYADWQMFMGNHYLTGNNDEIVPEDNRLNWQFEAPSSLFYPVPHKNIIFVNCLDKNLYAIDEITGKIIWKCKLEAPAIKSPVTYKNFVLVTAGDFLYVININTGKILWSRKEGISVQLSTPIVIDEIIYYGSRKFFYARDIFNGHLIWKNKNVKIYGGTPIYWNQRIYFLSKDFARRKSILSCISAKNGKTLWHQNIPSDPNIFTPVVYNKKVFVPSFNKLYAFNALNGEIIWIKKFNSTIASHTIFANENLYFSLSSGKIYVIKPENGKIITSFTNFNKTGANFIIVGETLFIPNLYGVLFAFNENRKKVIWKFETGIAGRKGFLSSQNGRIYLAIANYLYSISTGILPLPYQIVTSPQKERIEVTLKDNKDKPLEGEITVEQNNNISRYKADRGKATIEVEKDKEFTITAKAKDYFIKTINIKPKEKQKSIDINLDPVEYEKSYIFHNIQFKYNSAELTEDSIPTLKAIARFLKENPQLKIEIRGYTDNVGSEEFNLKLSNKRAEKVKEFLIKNGVLDTRVKAKGFGESNPIAPNNTEEGRAKNRRTEFIIIK